MSALEFVVPEGRRRTLASLVHDALGVSHRAAKELIQGKGITVDGRVVDDPVHRPTPGSRVAAPRGVEGSPRRAATRPIEGPGFRVVHFDADLVVVDKEAGIVTIPTSRPEPGDPPLVTRVLSALQVAGHRVRELHVVHRIDRDTSGLVVFTRSTGAAERLRQQFRAREPLREYVAWTEGIPAPSEGRLVHLLREDPRSLRMLVTTRRTAETRDAELTYVVEAVAPGPPPRARVRVRLVSGRRNQIRAQFGACGWSLVGDTFYGAAERGRGALDRVALHAARLAFRHPRTGRELDLQSPLPEALRRLDRRLFPVRRGRSGPSATPPPPPAARPGPPPPRGARAETAPRPPTPGGRRGRPTRGR